MKGIGDKQFLFVVGAPRSGTTWLHRMIWEHRQVAALETELTVFTYLGQWDKRYQQEKFHIDNKHWRQGAPLLFTEEEFYQGLRGLADEAYTKVLKANPEATHILDKHPGYSLHVPLIARLIPQSRFIHIIRDGREVAVSMISANRRLGFGAGEVRGASTEWHRNITHARRAGAALGPERYMEVRYEDLMDHTATELEKIFKFTGLPLSEDEADRIAREYSIERKQVSSGDAHLNALRRTPGAIWKARLSLEERWTMAHMVGHMLLELGYAGTSDWWALRRGDGLRMAMYRWTRKLRNTIGSTLHTWRTPLVKRIDP
jgi:hypothetical protein